MSFFNSHTLITALLLAPSLALPGSNAPQAAVQELNAGKLAAANPRAAFFRNVLHNSDYCNFTKVPTPADVPMKVGIIGAGAAGLYTAMLLDSLDIDYDIHEASDRIGGRIFTYRFDQEAWDNSTPDDPEYYDYYVCWQTSFTIPWTSLLIQVQDVGAMRFPPMPYMDRVIGNESWSLIPYINARVNESDKVVQKNYIFETNNTFRMYNNIRAMMNDTGAESPNRYNVPIFNTTFDTQSASDLWSNQVKSMSTELSKNFTKGFNTLMELDTMSVRQFLIKNGFANSEIDWMETVNDATGHYDTYSMSQAILEEWIFTSANISNWSLINGGSK